MPYLRKDNYTALVRAGRRMSNWLYNMGQSDACKEWAPEMHAMTREWDDSLHNARQTTKPQKKRKG